MTKDEKLLQQLRSDDPAEYVPALKELGFNVPDTEGSADLQAQLEQLEELDARRASHYAEYRAMVDPKLKALGVSADLIDVAADTALHLPALETPEGPQPDLRGAIANLQKMAHEMANRAQRRHLARRHRWLRDA